MYIYPSKFVFFLPFNYTFLASAFSYFLKKFVVKWSLFKIKFKIQIESFFILEQIFLEILTFWHFEILAFCHFDILWRFLRCEVYFDILTIFDIFWQNNNRIYLIFNSKTKKFCEVKFWHFLTFKCQNLTKMSKNVKMSKCFWELPLSQFCL